VEYGQVWNVLHNREGFVLQNGEKAAGDVDNDNSEAMNIEGKRHAAHSGQDRESDTLLKPNHDSISSAEGETALAILREQLIREGILSDSENDRLLGMLDKYKEHFTKRPGDCKNFEYKFQIDGDLPKSCSCRPIPFGLRKEVREQIQDTITEGIQEESFATYVNPLTLVQKDNKAVRICIDARRINRLMKPDRAKTPPMIELLQRFRGAKYITSLDLSKALLQIPLERSSREYTAFQFENKVYQFTRIPYGMKNALSGFIRALQTVLGMDSSDYMCHYVDDLVVFSRTFEEHIIHLGLVLGKLTSAGFNINIAKCKLCKSEIQFLGHIISTDGLSADPQKIEAVLNYPTPRNQKQLKRFLGVTNFHQRFIVNYAHYVAPLLSLLRKGFKWRWSEDMQVAFETLRKRFAHTISLIHPDNELPYTIHTDASSRAIAAVLFQKDSAGNTNIVSTVSPVLTPTEQRYTTCEQELLAIIFALIKFRIYIYGDKIYLKADHKALTFLGKCIVTSNRVARWLLELQQYDLEIHHVTGASNYLADVLSRNPAGLDTAEIKNLTKPTSIMVSAVDLKINYAVCKDLKNLGTLQRSDAKLEQIIEGIASRPTTADHKYRLVGDVLCCRKNDQLFGNK
jgi:hypothetical protein